MNFQNILDDLLIEQIGVFNPDFLDPDEVNNQGEEGDNNDINNPPIPFNPEDENDDQTERPVSQKKLSRTQLIKEKWKSQRPGLTDQEVSDAVVFFNERKDRLKPYKPYGTRLADGRFWVNLPEITALIQRFPDMEPMLSNEVQMKDMGNYTWEQMEFYMHRIFNQAVQFDDENFVKGDFSEDERIKWALERWKSSYNKIFDQDNITIFKISCKSEAIALGALDHAIYRKYNIENLSEAKRKSLTFTKDGVVYDGGIHPDILRKIDYRWGFQPWCVARPIGGDYGANLWTNYRPERAFYFLLDNNKPEWDEYHIVALQVTPSRRYIITTMPNNGDNSYDWKNIEIIYPQLQNKRDLFPYFGTTSREKKETILDSINFKQGDPDDFAIQSDAVHTEYIEDGRHIRDRRCFLTLSFENRKLYVDKATKQNNDYKHRFICNNPSGDPMAILDILKNEKVTIAGRSNNLYKYLDDFVLKRLLEIPEGVGAIKKSIVNQNFVTLYTDVEKNYTLISSREEKTRHLRSSKYGVMNLNNFDIIKDVEYIETKPSSYVYFYIDENGVKQRKIYTMQRFTKSIYGQDPNSNDYFYFLYLTKEVINRDSQHYMIGKFFEKNEGEAYLQDKINTGLFRKI